jgi:hypothetical protein
MRSETAATSRNIAQSNVKLEPHSHHAKRPERLVQRAPRPPAGCEARSPGGLGSTRDIHHAHAASRRRDGRCIFRGRRACHRQASRGRRAERLDGGTMTYSDMSHIHIDVGQHFVALGAYSGR